jgi:Fe2+ or Zn2+ uptake regulation protein
MARATVYNTLEALAATGLIGSLNAERGTRRFDPNTSPHHHLHCDGCGRIADLPADEVPASPALGNLRAPEFRVTGYMIEFHGYCSKCERRKEGGMKWQRN